jgi:hypothetical protein
MLSRKKRPSVIKFRKNTVSKSSDPDLMRVEVEKTRRASEIGKRCGLFRVPEVLEYDRGKGVAVFERLDIRPFSRAVRWGEERIIAARNLGASLAIIHSELFLPDDMCFSLPEQFVLPREEVFLHGDLGLYNVCSGPSRPHMVILDWQMSPLYGGRATYGTRYFDILWFIHDLMRCPSIRLFLGNPVAPVAKAFIESYFKEAKLIYDPDDFKKYATRFFAEVRAKTRQQVRGRGRLLLPFSRAILEEFMGSLRMIELI